MKKKRKLRHKFYHLLNRQDEYVEYLTYYLKEHDCDVFNIAKNSIFELELDLRNEYSNLYYNDGQLDDNHRRWNDGLKSNKTNIFSKRFWKEEIFDYKFQKLSTNDAYNVCYKYELQHLFYEEHKRYDWTRNLQPYDLQFDNNCSINDGESVNKLSNILQMDLEW